MPIEIKDILLISNGWLVGNACIDLLEDRIPKDFDIIVPNRELFHTTSKMMALMSEEDSEFNIYGGLKFTINGISIDIWCQELDYFLLNCKKLNYIFNMKKSILMQQQ